MTPVYKKVLATKADDPGAIFGNPVEYLIIVYLAATKIVHLRDAHTIMDKLDRYQYAGVEATHISKEHELKSQWMPSYQQAAQ